VEPGAVVIREGRDLARLALATIRSINGLVALLAPKAMLRRLHVDPDANGPAIYALRMFGIRTVLLGAELFLKEGEAREDALRAGVVIHGSDTVAAAICWIKGYLPRRAGAMATLISLVNTALAVAAQDRTRAREEVPADNAWAA
jgi:hypothetical protein